jgi:hypothetical protein
MEIREEVKQAYYLGAEMAVQAFGLEKAAFVPEALAKVLGGNISRETLTRGAESIFKTHPTFARMGIGAGAGGLIGGMNDDVGFGRGAMAGALGGLAYGPGKEWAGQAFKKNLAGGAEEAAAIKKRVDRIAAQKALTEQYGGPQSKFRRQLTNRVGVAGGLGAGVLAGGGAMAAMSQNKPKHWWE